MYFGFDCGDGWFDLLWMLSLALEEELGYSWRQSKTFLFKNWLSRWWNAYGWGNVWFPYTGVRATQVKEKYGTLRFYFMGVPWHESDARINTLIRLAERLSSMTCEQCGNYGVERGPGWIQTLCDDCHVRKEP
jgi:hypothetical protein